MLQLQHLPKTSWVLSILMLLFVIASCNNSDSSKTSIDDAKLQHEENVEALRSQIDINKKNTEAWDYANERVNQFSDDTFLKTTQPMSLEIMDPDPKTGLVGESAYNTLVYTMAVERVKKRSLIKDNQVYTSLKSGQEVNISEDIFDFIINFLYKNWNEGLKEGKLTVIFDGDEFHILPAVAEKKVRLSSSPINLSTMSHLQRWNALYDLYILGPVGDYIQDHVVLNFGKQLSNWVPYTNDRYTINDGCLSHGQPTNCIYNIIYEAKSISYSTETIYRLNNNYYKLLPSVRQFLF